MVEKYLCRELLKCLVGNYIFFTKMTSNRFRKIQKFLRFDLGSIRSVRLQTDKFVFISEVCSGFVASSTACYKLGENITVD